MPKVKPCVDNVTKKPNGNFYFRCPATGKQIELSTQSAWSTNQIVYSFNQDVERPTFSPLVLIVNDKHIGHEMVHLGNAQIVNHFQILDGNIRYMEDSTHHMRGKTVPLPELK